MERKTIQLDQEKSNRLSAIAEKKRRTLQGGLGI